jgi:L-fuculose-phosphate aldolase
LSYRFRSVSVGSGGVRGAVSGAGETQFVITPTGMPAVGLTPNELALVDGVDEARRVVYARGGGIEGAFAPSSEAIMHHAVYAARRDVNAVFHGHSDEIVKRADNLGFVQTRKFEEYGSLALAREAVKTLEDVNFIVLRGHGFLSVGATLREAGEQALRAREKALKTVR